MIATQLKQWVERVESLYEGEFKDLMFLEERNGRLAVPAPPQAWGFLRFELFRQQYLHLHSVGLRTVDGAPIAGPDVGISASSHYGPSLKLARARKLLDPDHPHRFGIHTLKDERPWFQLSLPSPVCLSDIEIQNRKEGNATRAEGMVVCASTDGVRWAQLYDGGARIRDFREHAIELGEHVFPGKEGAAVRDMILDVMTCRYELAHKAYSAPSFPEAMREPVQKLLSDAVLKRRELEWTSHGVRRSFRFWSMQEKVEYIELAARLVRDLWGLSSDACLGFGSILSVVRDKDLVAHDDDLDILVAFPRSQASSLTAARQITREYLEGLGYQVTGNFFSHWHVRRQGRKLDVFVGIHEPDGRIGWFPGKRGALKRDEVFPPALIDLLEVECPIPANPERYLEVVYGPKWRSPDPGWKHNWDHGEYLDIA